MRKLEEGEDMYFNAGGYMVFTREYLLERNYCCGNGCKHCPYDYKQVPEPRRTQLLKDRNEEENSENA